MDIIKFLDDFGKLSPKDKDILSNLEAWKIQQRNEINALGSKTVKARYGLSILEDSKQKAEIETENIKASVASGLDMLARKEAEFAKKVVEFEKQNAEFIVAENETKKLYAEGKALYDRANLEIEKFEQKLATDNAILEQIKSREVSIQMSIEKMETLIADNKRLESATLDEKSKVLDVQKQLAKDYSIALKNKEDLEEIKRLIGIDKQNLEKARADFQKEQNIIQTMKDELQEVIDKNNEKTKELAKREADVKVAEKNVSDKERAVKTQDLEIRMNTARLSEDKGKFLLLLKEKGLRYENLDI